MTRKIYAEIPTADKAKCRADCFNPDKLYRQTNGDTGVGMFAMVDLMNLLSRTKVLTPLDSAVYFNLLWHAGPDLLMPVDLYPIYKGLELYRNNLYTRHIRILCEHGIVRPDYTRKDMPRYAIMFEFANYAAINRNLAIPRKSIRAKETEPPDIDFEQEF